MYINVVVIGSDRYKIEHCYKRLKQFDTLTEARKYARQYRNAYPARIYFSNDTNTYITCSIFDK